jgi:uncharacterized protein with HEPN domain
VKDDRIYLRHIIEAIEDIEHYTSAGYGAFLREQMRQDAVIRKLEVIGEAVKHMSAAPKSMSSGTRWREFGAISDKLIQEYFGVDLEIVWATVEHDLPLLKRDADDLLASMQFTPDSHHSYKGGHHKKGEIGVIDETQ